MHDSDQIKKIEDLSLETATDIGELALDSLLGEGLLKDIPILGMALKAIKAGFSVRDFLLARKLARFLHAQSEQNHEAAREFSEEMASNPKLRERVGETLLLLLDTMNDFDKPEWLAKIFTAFTARKMSFQEFKRLGEAINQAHLDDLNALAGYIPDDKEMPPAFLEHLIPTNLARYGEVSFTIITGDKQTDNARVPGDYARGRAVITDLGALFINIANNRL